MGLVWVNCNLALGEGGAISSGSCDSPEQKNFGITLGEITIADTTNCVFSGYFEFEGSPVRVEHATLSPEKTVMAGAGAFTRGFFTFTMVKRAALR